MNLHTLNLCNNKVINMDNVKQLTNITNLNLEHNNIITDDIFLYLRKLKILSLKRNKIISYIQSYIDLISLNLIECHNFKDFYCKAHVWTKTFNL